MATKDSMVVDDDAFEFVDYTSASHCERLATAIEEILHTWGAADGSFGIFSNDKLITVQAAIRHPTLAEYSRCETLHVGSETYTLMYYCHPRENPPETTAEDPFLPLDFYLFTQSEDDPPKTFHPLHRWTGLDRILVLSPASDSLKAKLFSTGSDLNQTKLLLSACAMAFQNTQCCLPVFVPMFPSWSNVYAGYMLKTDGYEREIRFNCTFLPTHTTPHAEPWQLKDVYGHFEAKLDALLDDYGKSMAHTKRVLGVASDQRHETIFAAAVFTYSLKNLFDGHWKDGGHVRPALRDPTKHASRGGSSGPEPLAFGSFNDPLRSMTLSAVFPLARAAAYMDDGQDSHMDAFTAQHWRLACEFAPPGQQRAFLSTLLDQVVLSWIRDPLNRDYLDPYDASNAMDDDERRDRDPGLVRNLLHVVGQGRKATPSSSVNPASQTDKLETWVDTLFSLPESNKSVLADTYSTNRSVNNRTAKHPPFYTAHGLNMRIKHGAPTPYRSLLWTFVFLFFQTLSDAQSSHDSASYMQFLHDAWSLVLQRIRWHWENQILIPGVSVLLYQYQNAQQGTTTPEQEEIADTLGIDLRFNMLHQKLAMINCCIEKRRQSKDAKERPTRPSDTTNEYQDGMQQRDGEEEDSDEHQSEVNDDDTFFDTLDDITFSNIPKEKSTASDSPSFNTLTDASDSDAGLTDPSAFEGRDVKLANVHLLQTNAPLWVPITQDPGFMTKDMIQQQADMYKNLGTSKDASHLRVKLQSAHLLSDMQAFKAANPNAVFEDFVRWHSPRDWVCKNNDPSTGQLSSRMSGPDNVWQELWKSAKRIPASQQRPLFDSVTEGEKALHYLETLSSQQVFSFLLPTVALVAYDSLALHPVSHHVPSVQYELSTLGNEIIDFPWDDLRKGKCSFTSVVHCIRRSEFVLCQAISLLHKVPEQYNLVDRLLATGETHVNEGHEREAVFNLFRDENGLISEPSCREYVLYSDCMDSVAEGIALPLKLYTQIKKNELRMVDMQTTASQYQ